MRHQYFWLCGLLAFLACGPAFPQQQALITIDPNNFAPGQDLSNATTGAQLLTMTAVLNPDPNAPPGQFYLPKFLPVYAEPVTPDCNFFGATCAATGDSTLGFTQTTQPTPFPILWNATVPGALCLIGDCDGDSGGIIAFSPDLLLVLDTPTDHADALVAFGETDTSSIVAVALNGSGEVVSACIGFPNGVRGSTDPCATLFRFTGPPDAGWGRYSVDSPAGDIKYVLAGGGGSARSVGQVRFNSPVSVQLAGLVRKTTEVGPGKSLANTMIQAQADYAAGDILATCPLLASFVGEVSAQSGKHIDHLTALQLLSTATAIQTAIRCN